jgi:glycosyltransferase involved in cell wall biosynthesis
MGNVGTIKATINSAASLKQRGYEVKLYKIYREWEGYEDLLQKYGLETVDFGMSRYFRALPEKGIGFRFSMILMSIFSYGKLKKNWKQERPDVVIASLLGYLPLVVRKHCAYKPRIINSIQGRPRLNRIRKLLWKQQYASSDLLITLSDETQKEIAQKLHFPKEKIVRLDNPVIDGEIDRLKEEPLADFGENEKLILGVGRLTRQKNFSTLIRAYAALPERNDYKLVILGEGEERDKLETLIQELHLNDCVFLKGFVRNPYKYMARAKVFVLSSLWEDAGHVMLEAAYVKTPIVSTRCPSGQEEFLDYGKAGELCAVGDSKEMADCIHKVLQGTETGKVERAYNKSLNFTMERHGENLDRIIKGLTS